MPLTHARWLALLLAALAGCSGGPTTPGRKATPKPADPGVLDARGVAASLTGKVKLISDNGAGLIANNGSGIIANNSGGLVSDNGGGLISEHGGSFGLLAAPRLDAALPGAQPSRSSGAGAPQGWVEVLLANAVIALLDARGKPVLDAQGKPLATTTDGQGRYALAATLPPGNIVMSVTLHDGGLLHGGTLTAMLPHAAGAREQPIDTATSLGAAYVLGKFVQGDQTTYDKLPAAEADKLYASLAAARDHITAAPAYQQDALVGLADQLRGQVPAVKQELDTIQALLLGQAHLGDGRQANQTGIFRPVGLVFDPAGNLLFGEPLFGRIRAIAPDGTISTRADIVRGTLKQNYPRLSAMVGDRAGNLYITTATALYKLQPDGTSTRLAGEEAGIPSEIATIAPSALAVAADGTVYMAEDRSGQLAKDPPRVLALGADGQLAPIPFDPPLGMGGVHGLAFAPDGTLYLTHGAVNTPLTIYQGSAKGGALEPLGQLETAAGGSLQAGPDGTLYVTEAFPGRVTAYVAGKPPRVAVGDGGPAGTNDLVAPVGMQVAPDGALLVEDEGAGLIHRLGPDGSWRILAGTTSATAGGTGLRDLALDAPGGVAFDARGQMLVSEQGGYRIDRFDGSTITTFAGNGNGGFAGDGGPALAASMGRPGTLAFADGTLYVADPKNARVRAIAPDGTIRTVAGTDGTKADLPIGARVPASSYPVNGSWIATDPHGRLYIASNRQIVRLADDGRVEVVAGTPPGEASKAGGTASLEPDVIAALAKAEGGPAADAVILQIRGMTFAPNGDLYFTEQGNLQIKKVTGLDTPNPTVVPVAGRSALDVLAHLDELATPKEGGAARETCLALPAGIAVDARGNVYISELGSVGIKLMVALGADKLPFDDGSLPPVYARIRKIAPDGTMTTIAGPGGKIFTNPTADDALVLPQALAIAPDGRLVIVDTGANVLRILPAGSF